MNLRIAGLRLLELLVSLLVASLLVFLTVNALPGDVAQVVLGTNASPGEVEALRQRWGLDRPMLARYAEWVGGLVQGDLGRSLTTGRDVGSQIWPRLGVTAWVAGLGMVFALLVALPLGAWAAVRRRHADGFAVSALSQVGMAVPAFWAGICLVIVFSVLLGWLPAGGYVPLSRSVGEWASHLVLPVASLALVQGSLLARYVRSGVVEVLTEDWFRTARSIGWSTPRALVRHGGRNIAISLLSVVGVQLATVLVGAIVIEQVFALPGIGSRLLLAVGQRDLVLVQAIVMLLVAIVLVLNFVLDLVYRVVDPRIREVR